MTEGYEILLSINSVLNNFHILYSKYFSKYCRYLSKLNTDIQNIDQEWQVRYTYSPCFCFVDYNVLACYLLLPVYLKERVHTLYVMEDSEVSSIDLMYMIAQHFKHGKRYILHHYLHGIAACNLYHVFLGHRTQNQIVCVQFWFSIQQ